MTKQNKNASDVKLVEKALRIGLGLISLGEEKAGELAGQLEKRGEEYAGRVDSAVSRLAASLTDKSETVKEKGSQATDWITREIKAALRKVNFATKDELNELRAELEELKKKLDRE